ncbi:binding-protein-dependent transport systems inner membrane component [Candidatus Vecturithrix granuli]|uniref:Binding-protein-dependent transport systems inner membrane component n=1 Tax=Vecturithrix granuli TaxID=1499967 RepID=A0A0S6W5U9_VECG1|nr:binding-protein-dependent transport systems inner membrane component [Candidatus Vecturithrix granuli]
MKKKHDFLVALLFILPALAIYLFYFIFPIPASAYYSFFQWNGISPTKKFLGFGNWVALFNDPAFWKALTNNIILVIASILIQLPIGLILGVFVSSKLKGTKFLKLIYFLPMLLSAVAIGLTWNFIYEPTFGLFNAFLNVIGLGRFATGWLGEEKFALWAVIIAICWQYIPYYMVLFAAALAGIPQELYEAAYIDGASKGQGFLTITLPLLKNTIRIACVLSLTGSLKYFALIFVMTGGGPNHASELLATYMFKQAFTSFRMGYGSAIAVFMFMISFVLTVFILRKGKRQEEIVYG